MLKCDDCEYTGDESEFKTLSEINHLWERLEPGGTVPSGECPKCGALVYEAGVPDPKPDDCSENPCSLCVERASEPKKDYVKAAHRLHHEDGKLEIDEDAKISECEEGAYVQAWIYVGDDQVKKEEVI